MLEASSPEWGPWGGWNLSWKDLDVGEKSEMAWRFLAWLSTQGATSPASHCKREGGGRECSPGPQTPHAGQRTDGRWGLRKEGYRAAGAKWGKGERKRVGRGRRDKKDGSRGVNAENWAGRAPGGSAVPPARRRGIQGTLEAGPRAEARPLHVRAAGPSLGASAFLPSSVFLRTAHGPRASSELAYGAAGTEVTRLPGCQEHSPAPAATIKLAPKALSQQDAKQHPGPGGTAKPAAARAAPLQAVQKEQTARPLHNCLFSFKNGEEHFIQVSLIYFC